MRRAPGALLRHQPATGPAHLDLVIAAGGRCPTAQLSYRHLHLAWRWGAPHRRFYLGYSGPLSAGRGRVRQIWYGWVRWSPRELRFNDIRLTRMAVVPSPALRTLFRP